MNKLTSFLCTLLCATTVLAGPTLSGSGTQSDPYLIGSLSDWKAFARYVNNNYTELDEYFLMTADIGPINDYHDLIGLQAQTYTRPFKGIFDGGGHTLTMDFDLDIFGYVAPFLLINNATIKNLHVTGEVTVAEPYAGGIVLDVWSAYECNTIENCRVSTKIVCNASTSGESWIGGFVGRNQYKEMNITGCVFDGQIIAPNVTGCAGFVGWNDTYTYGHVNINDCVFAPAIATVQGGKTFVRSQQYGDYVTISNCFYTTPLGDVQGKAPHTITGNEGVTVAMAGEPTEYNMSGITAYSGKQDDVNSKYDVRKGSGKLKVGETASIVGEVKLDKQYATYKINTKNADGSANRDINRFAISVTTVQNYIASTQEYVITPDAPTSELYVALPAVDNKYTVFYATDSNGQTYAYSQDSITTRFRRIQRGDLETVAYRDMGQQRRP